MKKIFILFLLFFYSAFVFAVEPSVDLYAQLLDKYVKAETHHETTLNWVNYSGLKQDPDFNKLVQAFSRFSPETLEGEKEKLAFYINAYNILAIKTIVDHWPVESIKDVGSFIRPVWKKEAGEIGGKKISLNEIEHKILRPMGEPRIHLAIVCASISCPDIRNEPYTAEKLDNQLDDQARKFLSNSQKGLLIEGNTARVSKIFDWFEDDFNKKFGSVSNFISKYSDLPKDVKLKANLPYNWSVNGE